MNHAPRVLMTGAGGFVGRAVVSQLETRGLDVLGCDLHCDVHGAARAVNVLDVEALKSLTLEVQPTCFVHGAAITTASRADELDLLEVNLRGTTNALRAARAAGVTHFVLLSSAGVYAPGQPEPINELGATSSDRAYSLSKTLAEEICDLGKFESMTVWVLRLAAIYGPGETVSPSRSKGSLVFEIARQRHAPRVELPRAAGDAYNFLHTRDLARLLEKIARRPNDGGTHVYNVGGETATALEIVRAFDIALTVARPYLHLEMTTPIASRVIWNPHPAPRHGALSSSKLRHELGFEPNVSLEMGVLDYLEVAPMEVT